MNFSVIRDELLKSANKKERHGFAVLLDLYILPDLSKYVEISYLCLKEKILGLL